VIPSDGHGRVLRRFAVVASFDVVGRACGFLTYVLLARHLGAEGNGAVSVAQQVAAFGLQASAFGLDVLAVRVATGRPAALGAMVSTIVSLRAGLGLLAFAATTMLALLVPAFRDVLPLILAYGLTYFSGALLPMWVPQAVQRPVAYGLASAAQQGLALVLLAGAFAAGGREMAVPVTAVLAELGVAAALLAWAHARVTPLRPPLPWADGARLLRDAAPIALSQVMRTVALGSDLVLAGALLSLQEAGHYAAAYRVYVQGVAGLAIYFVVLYPHVAGVAARSEREALSEMRVSLRRTVIVAVAGLAVAAALASPAVRLVFTAEYLPSVPILRVLLVVLVASLANGHLRQALIALGRQREDLRNTTIGAAAHVVAKAALIPALGTVGLAAGHLVGELALVVAGAWSLRRRAP
jgi:O-antigen/teichoic acid export membrane protein